MSKEEVIKYLVDKKCNGDSKIILEFCKEPKTGGDLMRFCKTKKEIFSTIVDLKVKGAVAFENGKYITTKLGLDIIVLL